MFESVSFSNSEVVFDQNIVFIDSQVDNYQDLISGVERAEVVIIERDSDGIEQITASLDRYDNLSSVQIISHGDAGYLDIGTTSLSSDNLEEYTEELQQWSQHLTQDADILLFGCKIGRDADFLESLRDLTSADIAASDDLTGHTDLKGDWQLEINLGDIESTLNIDTATLQNYESVLEISQSELVLEVDFNDASANIARDSAPDLNSNNGQLTNGAIFALEDEPFNGVVRLNGDDDLIAIANSTEINLSDRAQRTVSVWFNAEDVNTQDPQIIYEEGGTTRGLNIYLDRGQLYVGGWNQIESNWSGTFLGSNNINSNTWHHVALVLDAQPEATAVQSEVLFAYLDGVEIGRGTGSQIWQSFGGVAFGGLNYGTKLHTGNIKGNGMFGLLGTIDEARIYNRALDAAEISVLAEFNAVDSEKLELPVAQLKLDEVSGNQAEDSQGNNSGTLRNGAFFETVGADLGGGVSFDGNDDFIEIANSTDINLGIHAKRTISVWFNADEINNQNPQVIYEEGATVRGLNIYLDRGQLYVGGWNQIENNWSGTFVNSENINSDTWHHVALVLDAQPGSTAVQSEVLFAYLDGVEIGRGSGGQIWGHSGGIGLGGVNGSTKFHSGNLNGTGVAGFKGNIASLEIYNQALDLGTIATLANINTPTTPEIVTVPPVSSPQKFTANNEYFNYDGRIDWQDPQAPALGYGGTSVEFKFTGTKLQIELSEDSWGSENYVDIYLDNNPEPITIKLRRENGQPIIYDIAEGLENKVHNAVIYKRNDYSTGEFNFHGIITDGQLLQPNLDSQRTIEVYGDSISSGIAVEHPVTGVQDPSGSTSSISNAYYSYGSILARDYDAEVSLVAQGGVPLVNGFGYWNTFWNNGTGGEAIYDKVKPLHNAPIWDFSNYSPDLVIIAYGQNDSSTVGNNLSKQEWKERYKQMIANLREKHPNSYFIGMFPAMFHNRQWDSYITEAIAEYRTEYNDDRVFSLIHEQVTPGHPRISEQETMADTLREFIDGTLTDNGFNWDVN